jgi:hypothetical protein
MLPTKLNAVSMVDAVHLEAKALNERVQNMALEE